LLIRRAILLKRTPAKWGTIATCCFAVITLVCRAWAAGGAETDAALVALDTLDRLIAVREASTTTLRLRTHLLLRCGKREEARELLEVASEGTQVPNDLLVHHLILQTSTTNRQAALSRLRGLAKSEESPTTTYLYFDFVRRAFPRGPRIMPINTGTALQWVPLLRSAVDRAGGSWLVVAKQGAAALELVAAETPITKSLLMSMPRGDELSRDATEKEMAKRTLDNFLAWCKRNNVSDKDPALIRRLQAPLLYHAGLTEDAITLYEELVEKHEATASAFYRLARLYESSDQQTKADATIKAGISRFPEQNSILLVTAAEYAIAKGNTEEAVGLARQCLTGSSEYPAAHLLLAEIEVKRGNHSAALEACADTAAYSYGWDGDYITRINAVLEALVQQAQQKDK